MYEPALDAISNSSSIQPANSEKSRETVVEYANDHPFLVDEKPLDMPACPPLKSQLSRGGKQLSLVLTSATARRRSTTLSALRHVLFFQLSLVGCSGVFIALYVWACYAIPCDLDEKEFPDANMRKAMPNFLWYAIVDKGIVAACVVTPSMCMVSELLLGPEIAFTRNQKVVFAAVYSTLNVVSFLLLFSISSGLTPLVVLMGATTQMAMCCLFTRVNMRRLKQTRVSDRRVIRRGMKCNIVYILGYVSSKTFAVSIFPSLVKMLDEFTRETDGSVCISLWCYGVRYGSEMFVVFLFFSLYLPIWKKCVCQAAMELCTCARGDVSQEQDYSTEVQTYWNFLCDTLSLVVARGVLGSVSHPLIFFAILLKDCAGQCWHYGFKYMDEYIIFMLKAGVPAERKALNKNWLAVLYIMDQLQYVYVTTWNISIQGLWEPHPPEPRTLLRFHDVRLELTNSAEPVASSGKTLADPESTKTKFAQSVFADRKAFEVPSFPRFPVTAEEIRRYHPICCKVQRAIFMRYQSRAVGKLFTSVIFLAIPIFSSYTNMRYHPDFESPLNDSRLLMAGCSYVAMDLGEWLVLTFGVFYRYEGLHDCINEYRYAVMKNKRLVFSILFLANLFGTLWFASKLTPSYATKYYARYPGVDVEAIFNICKSVLQTASN